MAGDLSLENVILLASCPDQRGIVAAVTSCVRDLGGNLIDLDQHTDIETNTLYMRVEWEGGATRAAAEQGFTPVCERFGMTWTLRHPADLLRVALFVTQQGHCLWDLLQRHQAGELPMIVGCVIGNHATLQPVAATFGVPFHHVPVLHDDKAGAEARTLHLLEEAQIDLVVLARYMQILSPDFVARYPARIINVHHSFLPAFVGARPYHQAYERGVKLIGATAHYVTTDLDHGPIIEQVVDRVGHTDGVADLVRKGRDLERMALARALRLHLHSRVLVYGNKTAVF